MKTKNIIRSLFAYTLASFLLLPLAVGDDLKVHPNKENVVASKLEGSWGPDVAISKRLKANYSKQVLKFKSDDKVLATIPGKLTEVLAGRTIYMAGTMTRGKVDYPFVLIQIYGNPYVVYFRSRSKSSERLDDVESFIVMFATADKTEDDLLFIGGDFNGESFTAYSRITPKK